MGENETGKCKKAKNSVEVIGKQAYAITGQLKIARNKLIQIAGQIQKKPAMAPVSKFERIEFYCNKVHFYIDFCLVSEDDYLEGAIVYGVLRAPHYPYSLWGSKNTKENRPLFSFSVDEYGKIRAKGKLDDEWWLKDGDEENKKSMEEMHYRVLDLVWRDALNWVNEAFLP